MSKMVGFSRTRILPVVHFLLLAICVTGISPSSSRAQDSPTAPPSQLSTKDAEQASVEQLTAMLQMIDPYRPVNAANGKITVFGSTSMDAMAHGWAKGFKQFHPQVEVEISGGGSEATFEQLLSSPDSIGMLSRPVTDEELAELKKRGLKEPAAIVVAREALGVFVNSNNPVTTISGEQLRTVFTVGIKPTGLRWDSMGAQGQWAKQPINVISRSENSGTQRFLADFVFCSCSLREGISSHVSNAQVLQAVSDDPLAIAICGLRSTGESVKTLQLTTGANIVPSDDHAVLSGQYPLTRPLTLVLDLGQEGSTAQAAREFVQYALCNSGQTEAIMVGFYPVDLPLLRAGQQRLGAALVR